MDRVADDGSELHVEGLGEPEERPFGDLDAEALDEVEAGDEQPLSEEEARDLIAGAWEAGFGAGGWWLGAGAPVPFVRPGEPLPQPIRAEVEATWQLPTDTSRRLASSTYAAMPRSWRESRALQRLPVVILAMQVGALVRIRMAATEQIIVNAQEGHFDPVTDAGRRAAAQERGGPPPRAAGARSPIDPDPARTNGGHVAAAAKGLGLGGPISARAAERRERRFASTPAGDAERVD